MAADGAGERGRSPNAAERSKGIEMLRNVASSLLVFVSTSLAWSVADGAWVNRPYTRCEAEVDQRLNRIDVDRADIEKIFYTRQFHGGGRKDRTRVVGTDAWVRFHSCKGSLVIDLDRYCRVRQVYTRGQCKIPGLKNFF